MSANTIGRSKIMNWERLKATVVFWLAVVLLIAFILFVVLGAAAPESKTDVFLRRLAIRVKSLENRVESLESHLTAFRGDAQYGRLRRSRARERHLNRVERRLRSARFVEKYDYLTNDKYKYFPEQEEIDIYERRHGDE